MQKSLTMAETDLCCSYPGRPCGPCSLAASSRPTSDTPGALGPGDPDKRLLENAEVLKYGYFL
jgi:hypothetical protein